MGQASIKYSVPKTTIFDQIKRGQFKKPQKGRFPVFNPEQEEELVQRILNSCKTFYDITVTTLRKIAYDFAEANKLKHIFNRDTGLAGMDWYYSFKNRHPNISLRIPESTSLNRITSFNESEVNIFFNNLKLLQEEHNFVSERMFNVDETGITNVHKNSKILARKGLKQVGKVTSGERGTTTTVVCSFSAGGTYIPPMFIFKRKRMAGQLMKGCNSNMIATVSDSGWINESLFIDWLHHFIKHTNPSKENPVLLIFDNHEPY